MKNTPRLTCLLAVCLLALTGVTARASIAYGSINNFDTVNDTGVPCHGFEIELDDIHCQDVTYTFSWNHYGTPKIREDIVFTSGAWHTNVYVRYAAVWTNTGWSAYTAVPAGPIPPTQGHQFTNPGTNFGGEHFGVGYRRTPSAVKYNWLIDNGAGGLVHGGAVNVATPTFVYIPPVPPPVLPQDPPAAPAQVQAAIVPPPPPVPDPLEFGEASWVKEIRTTTHNANPVKLRDLVSDDPADPNDKNWRNGEPDEVEVEWQILQVDHNSANGGANGELVGAPENLNHGDEVVTRRYEFYKYVGPLDAATGEAFAQSVGPDGIHGVGLKTNNGVVMDFSTNVVVGDFIGSQMAAFDVDEPVGLIDHLQDGAINTAYPARTVVISGTTNFAVTSSGALPSGMTFDHTNGIVSGTPTASGVFTFNVQAAASNNPVVTKTYLFTIAAAGVVLPPHSSVDASSSPTNGGTTTGTGVYTNGTTATVTATPNAGFIFLNWTDNGVVVSSSTSYQFTNEVNRSLVANFFPGSTVAVSAAPANAGLVTGGGFYTNGTSVTVTATPNAAYIFQYWLDSGSGLPVSSNVSYTFTLAANRVLVAQYACPAITVSPGTLPAGTLVAAYDQTNTVSGGTAPYIYAVTIGSLPSGLTLTADGILSGTPTANGSFAFTVTATDANGCTGSTAYNLTVTVSGPGDATPPTVKIATPASKAVVSNPAQVLAGTAKDNPGGSGVTAVQLSVNGGAWQPVTTANGFTNWTQSVTLVPGPNTVIANAQDFQGNNASVTNTYFLTATQPFSLLTVGTGTVTATKSTYGTPTNGATLIVNRPYTVAAVSGSNYLFSNWLASVDGGPTVVATNTAKYTFLMQTNLTLTAQFVTNRFLDTVGSYNGLFWDTNNGVAYNSAGFASIKITAKQGKLATFSASLSVAGEKPSFSGTFDLSGAGESAKLIRLKANTNTALKLYLNLPFDGTISGMLSNLDGSWSAALSADKDEGVAAYAGQYTMILPGSTNAAVSPGGDGYGLVTVDTNGVIALTGALGDGTAISQKVPVSENGDWPLFASVYATATNSVNVKGGLLMGWMNLTNGLEGTLYLIKTAVPGVMYPNGFTNELVPLTSIYTNSALATNRVIEWTSGSNGVVILSGGDLSPSLTNLISLSTLNMFKAPATNTAGGTNKLLLTVAVKTGKLTGSFKTNGVTSSALNGVVLQNANTGHGYFKGATNSGGLLLQGR